MRDIHRRAVVPGFAVNLDVILNQYAVVKDRHASTSYRFANLVEAWRGENNVITLPFAWRARGVYQRRMLFVDGSGLAVKVGFVVVRIEHLHFVMSHQEDAAVASPLTFAFDFRRRCPFDV